MEEVFIVFEEQQLSCDRDYNEDGFTIVWDSEEVGRNISVETLSKEIEGYDRELHTKLIKHMKEELQLNDFGMAEDYLTEIMEFLTKETDGILYMFYYQNASLVKEVHKTEESAKKAVEYYTKERHYMNKFYHCKFRLIENKPRVCADKILSKVRGIVPKENSDSEVLTVGEVRKLMADMFNNLPSDDSELIKTAKGMVKQIDDRQDYVSRRIHTIINMVDQCKERSKITKGKEKEDLLRSVEIGQGKLNELNLLKKELSINR